MAKTTETKEVMTEGDYYRIAIEEFKVSLKVRGFNEHYLNGLCYYFLKRYSNFRGIASLKAAMPILWSLEPEHEETQYWFPWNDRQSRIDILTKALEIYERQEIK